VPGMAESRGLGAVEAAGRGHAEATSAGGSKW
jgi:hypothetical protein